MNTLDKLATIAHKNNIYITEDGGEHKVLKLIIDELNDNDRIEFYSDTFGMFQDEIDALYDSCRDLTDDELRGLAEEDNHNYKRGDLDDI